MKSKSYGEVLWEKLPGICMEDTNYGHPWKFCHQEECEEAAEAVISEFCERNVEVAVWVHPFSLTGNSLAVEVSRVKLGKQQVPLFLSPQPKEVVLPSVEELMKVISCVEDNYDAKEAAEAVLKLLKEKNKDE